MEPKDLNNTSWIVLGLLRITGDKTGYELKQLIDQTTDHFWPSSYGRIYPELRRLADHGLVASHAEQQGARSRIRYSITPSGRDIVERWLTERHEPLYELRDEGILRLLIAAVAQPADMLPTIAAMRRLHAEKLRQLEDVHRTFLPAVFADPTIPRLLTEGGIGFHTWYVDWCDRLTDQLTALLPPETDTGPPDDRVG